MAATAAGPQASPMSRPSLGSNKEYSKIFRPPPQSTASTPSTAAKAATSADYFSTTGSRKRSRADSSMGKSMYASTEVLTPAFYTNARSPSDDGACSIFSTESLVVNDRYRLAGGFDTPALLATGDLDTSVDLDAYTRRCMTESTAPRLHITEPAFQGPLARERNGFARTTQQAPASPSWTKLAIALPFSIAGKMFSFGSTVLKGFYAGQGEGFELKGSRSRYSTPQWRPDPATPMPGQWYEPNVDTSFEGDFEQDNAASASRPPPAKRRTTDKDWVVVDSADVEPAPPPTSPKKRPSTATTPRVGRPRASSRRSFMTHSRRQSYNNNSPSMTTPQQAHALPRLSMPASPTRGSPSANAAFPSPDAERFARRQAKQERAADKAMNSMSRQLEELIRQGQAALGTKFTVEENGFDEDEGFVDEY